MAQVSTRYEYKVPATPSEQEAHAGALTAFHSDNALSASLCGERRGGMTCTREFGHKGWHIAAGTSYIYLRWAPGSWNQAYRARKSMERAAAKAVNQ